MPVYEFVVSAKINIRMDGATAEEACANLESLLEDFYMQIPCQGHEIHFGKYPAEVWANETKPSLKRQMPEGNDPTKTQRMTMKRWMDLCLGREDFDEDKGADLPEDNKEDLLKKEE